MSSRLHAAQGWRRVAIAPGLKVRGVTIYRYGRLALRIYRTTTQDTASAGKPLTCRTAFARPVPPHLAHLVLEAHDFLLVRPRHRPFAIPWLIHKRYLTTL